jgi:hypothetical protein
VQQEAFAAARCAEDQQLAVVLDVEIDDFTPRGQRLVGLARPAAHEVVGPDQHAGRCDGVGARDQLERDGLRRSCQPFANAQPHVGDQNLAILAIDRGVGRVGRGIGCASTMIVEVGCNGEPEEDDHRDEEIARILALAEHLL